MKFANMSDVMIQLKFFFGIAVMSVGMLMVCMCSIIIGMPISAIVRLATGDPHCHALTYQSTAAVAVVNIAWLLFCALKISKAMPLPSLHLTTHMAISCFVCVALMLILATLPYCSFVLWYCGLSMLVCAHVMSLFGFCHAYQITFFDQVY